MADGADDPVADAAPRAPEEDGEPTPTAAAAATTAAAPKKKKFVGRKAAAALADAGTAGTAVAPRVSGAALLHTQQVPDSLLQNAELQAACACLPTAYNFELPKTIWRLQNTGCKRGTYGSAPGRGTRWAAA